MTKKKCGFKQSKNRKYFKGVSPSFLSKNRIFYQQCLFRKLDQKRSFFDILERKEWLLDPKKWSFKKSKKSKFFKGVSPWFLSENRIFDQGNCLGKLSHKALFLDVLDRKECLDQKKCGFKQSKNRKYFKGVSPSFLSKNRIFYQQCLFRKLDQKRSFFDILERKEWLLDPKKWSFKKSKKSKFFKGVSPWFLSENRIFDQGNCLGKLSHKALFLDVLDRKECFLDHKHSFKNSKNRKFFQGG